MLQGEFKAVLNFDFKTTTVTHILLSSSADPLIQYIILYYYEQYNIFPGSWDIYCSDILDFGQLTIYIHKHSSNQLLIDWHQFRFNKTKSGGCVKLAPRNKKKNQCFLPRKSNLYFISIAIYISYNQVTKYRH